jgi:hypothetical protein
LPLGLCFSENRILSDRIAVEEFIENLKISKNESTVNKTTMGELNCSRYKDVENRTWKTHFRGKIYIH